MKKINLILIILIIFSLYYSKAFCYTLPLPENTKKITSDKLILNSIPSLLETYESSLSPEEIISFYKERLIKDGFILLVEHEIVKALHFFNPQSRQSLTLQVDDRLGDLTNFAFISWQSVLPTDKGLSTRFPTDNKEPPGKDLPKIPRYPGSVRISSMELPYMRNASYRSSSSQEEISGFYEERMPKYGWRRFIGDTLAKQKAAEILGGKALEGNEYFLFERKDAFCGILIGDSECCAHNSCGGDAKGNIITILWIPKQESY